MDTRSLASSTPSPILPVGNNHERGVRFHISNTEQQPSSSPATPLSSPALDNGRPGRLLRQRLRIQKFQQRWENIKEDLPPQLSRSHIGMISIGGVIGTGLFLGSGQALYNGGPVGALLGYSIIGTVVYCLCVSIGEMIAFLPNVGGVVGLADLFVDPALGFSMGWAAWYNWSVTLPAEIAAATVLFKQLDQRISPVALSGILLLIATAVLTIVVVIIVSVVIDLGGSHAGFMGFQRWSKPFNQYQQIPGALGHFLGFWAVLLQACFSFFGSEVPGIAAGEVIEATRNVPRALQRVWIRITVFYIGAIFCAGLLVDSTRPELTSQSSPSTPQSSPFVLAFKEARIKYLPSIINIAILISAWSAAASDIYISSRFLFFLAKNQHAPEIFSYLRRYPRVERPQSPHTPVEDLPDVDDLDDDELQPLSTALENTQRLAQHRRAMRSIPEEDQVSMHSHKNNSGSPEIRVTVMPASQESLYDPYGASIHQHHDNADHEALDHHEDDENRANAQPVRPKKQPWFVLPLYAVLASASVGFLSFLGAGGGGAEVVFSRLSAVASIASLQSWICMLYTYIRWHKGTIYHERKHRASAANGNEQSRQVIDNINLIKVNRHRGQPWLALYAFSVCMLILLTNGWSVFLHNGWRIADIPGEESGDTSTAVSIFLSSYVPIPFFILLTLGYKIIYQTKIVQLDEMDFQTTHFRREEPDNRRPSRRERILGALLVI